MNLPPVVSPEEWKSAREELLAKEKELTRARDALAAERRRMPRQAEPYGWWKRHDEYGDAVVGDGSFLVVGLGEHRVHPLQDALGDARGLAEPGRGGEDEDLGVEDLPADPRLLRARLQRAVEASAFTASEPP